MRGIELTALPYSNNQPFLYSFYIQAKSATQKFVSAFCTLNFRLPTKNQVKTSTKFEGGPVLPGTRHRFSENAKDRVHKLSWPILYLINARIGSIHQLTVLIKWLDITDFEQKKNQIWCPEYYSWDLYSRTILRTSSISKPKLLPNFATPSSSCTSLGIPRCSMR